MINLNDDELIRDVTQWNKKITHFKNVQRDFWLGIYYPNVYDEFETIELANLLDNQNVCDDVNLINLMKLK